MADPKLLADYLMKTGAGGKAANIVELQRQYRDYVIETQTQGQQPLTFDQWAQGRISNTPSNPYQNR